MHPHVWDGIRAWPLAMALAVVVGIAVVVRLGRADGLSLGRLLGFQLTVAAVAILGAKLHSLGERGALHLFGWETLIGDGFRYPGGIVAAIVAVPLAARLWCPRVPLLRLGDLVAISIPFALIPVRFGCFLYGCCFGVVSSLPWALSFPPGSPAANYHLGERWIAVGAWSMPVHPVHFYFLALDLVTAGVLVLMWRRPTRFPGQIMLGFLVVHEFGKFLIEFLRAADPFQQGRFIQSGPLALAVAAMLVWALVERYRGRRGDTSLAARV